MNAGDATAVVQLIDRRIEHHIEAAKQDIMARVEERLGQFTQDFMQGVYQELELQRQGFANSLTQLGANDQALHEAIMAGSFPNLWGEVAQGAWARFVIQMAQEMMAGAGGQVAAAVEQIRQDYGDFPAPTVPDVGTREPVSPAQSEVSSPPLPPPPPPPVVEDGTPELTADQILGMADSPLPGTVTNTAPAHLTPREG